MQYIYTHIYIFPYICPIKKKILALLPVFQDLDCTSKVSIWGSTGAERPDCWMYFDIIGDMLT